MLIALDATAPRALREANFTMAQRGYDLAKAVFDDMVMVCITACFSV